MKIPGIHHVTAFARSPRANIDFYTKVLGLRMIKVTVNYDDSGTYHLYYADRIGSPGTVMTFFPHPNAGAGRRGTGLASVTAFDVPADAIDFWQSRLAEKQVIHERGERFGQPYLRFGDSDGLQIELVGGDDAVPQVLPWASDSVSSDRAIRGFHSVTLAVRDSQPTVDFLRNVFNFSVADQAGDRTRLRSSTQAIASIVDIEALPDGPRGSFGKDTVHHVAWRVPDETVLKQMQSSLIDRGVNVTEVKNRNYFRSIYFREPGGVIFEIATDGPGFTIDEPEDALGSGLCLPPWLEENREAIEAQLPSLDE